MRERATRRKSYRRKRESKTQGTRISTESGQRKREKIRQRKKRKYLPLGRASIASGYTPAALAGRCPAPLAPKGGVFKGKVRDLT